MSTHARAVIRATIQRAALGLVVCLAMVLFAFVAESSRSDAPSQAELASLSARASLSTVHVPSFAVAARNGVKQLIGKGGGYGSTPASQEPDGLWGYHIMPNWWQSALALWSLVRYLEQTRSTDPIYQHSIMLLYNHNVIRPRTHAPLNFANEFNDDTGWWGVAWLEAARYELNVRHDVTTARKFVTVAEWDANIINNQKRVCGGLQWGLNKPPDTTTMAEFMHLTAGLYRLRMAPGPFHNPREAGRWLVDSQWALNYMTKTDLINMKRGTIADSLYRHQDGSCSPYGQLLTYNQGEVAEALIQTGMALHQPWYYREALKFLRVAIDLKSGLIRHGILREHCEDGKDNCGQKQSKLDLPAYKGILVNALADYDGATGTNTFKPFLLTQAAAVVQHAILGGPSASCRTPSTCLFGFFWAPPPHLSSQAVGVTLGGQESGIEALTAVLHPPATSRSSRGRLGAALP
jgi:hypothetical protein